MNPEDLRAHWKGAKDIWPSVPDDDQGQTRSIQSRVRQANESDVALCPQNWPRVVRNSELYGMGAYNPLGQTGTDEYNTSNHELLRKDISRMFGEKSSDVVWWEAASYFADGDTEPGFIIAFNRALSVDDLNNGEKLVVDLAKKYRQGAIYKFEYKEGSGSSIGKLFRSTIPVLVPDTEATVEVVMEVSALSGCESVEKE